MTAYEQEHLAQIEHERAEFMAERRARIEALAPHVAGALWSLDPAALPFLGYVSQQYAQAQSSANRGASVHVHRGRMSAFADLRDWFRLRVENLAAALGNAHTWDARLRPPFVPVADWRSYLESGFSWLRSAGSDVDPARRDELAQLLTPLVRRRLQEQEG